MIIRMYRNVKDDVSNECRDILQRFAIYKKTSFMIIRTPKMPEYLEPEDLIAFGDKDRSIFPKVFIEKHNSNGKDGIVEYIEDYKAFVAKYENKNLF